jgi:hypothetical protein
MRPLSMRLVTVAALVGASLAVPTAVASASAQGRCVSDNGTNVNAYFGVGRADVIWQNLQRRQPPCLTVARGGTFYRAHGWFSQLPPGTVVDGDTIETVYPEGYRPDHPAPMVDFLSKIKQTRYVISRDGQVVMARTLGRRALLRQSKLGVFGDLFVAPDTASGFTIHGASPEWTALAPLSSRRLSVGQYRIDVYWTFTEQHCDGFTTDPVASCLPAGESLATGTTFDVVPRRT